ncbi:uncharacterized protein STEHIDRAFT_111879 [Stereum hirsutum FP-91666 SS1]|uniref:uncharacterized protein n=1 Tax=Stereum hirsutum (strain FP-91666) TaxID=721885 RepID=UPI000444A3C6|nr:uncharacterized protein STEHIDRAFT_111879 [Stereum hirsutum FP-91666 SS1]EIM85269.1 hypothetical protein STEHIDRAFT_111879 [Stereum hirsutum FP-91666 SS1]
MQFLSTILSLGFVASAFAQTLIISPADGSSVRAGQTVNVTVQEDISSAPTTDVSIVIGISKSSDSHTALEQILYAGTFAPTENIPGRTTKFESFSLQVPEQFSGEEVAIGATRFFLSEGAAGWFPVLQSVDITLNVN